MAIQQVTFKEIANKVYELIRNHPNYKNIFQKHIETYHKKNDEYYKYLTSFSPEKYVLWYFGLNLSEVFDTNKPIEPSNQDERLMCEYAGLAIIHDTQMGSLLPDCDRLFKDKINISGLIEECPLATIEKNNKPVSKILCVVENIKLAFENVKADLDGLSTETGQANKISPEERIVLTAIDSKKGIRHSELLDNPEIVSWDFLKPVLIRLAKTNLVEVHRGFGGWQPLHIAFDNDYGSTVDWTAGAWRYRLTLAGVKASDGKATQKTPTGQNSGNTSVVNKITISNSQIGNVQAGVNNRSNSNIEQHKNIEEKKSVLWKIVLWVVGTVFAVIITDILGNFGWLKIIRNLLSK